jgi:hypothetical protein
MSNDDDVLRADESNGLETHVVSDYMTTDYVRLAQKLRFLKKILSEVPNRQKTWHLQDEALSIKSKGRNRGSPGYGD